MLYSCYKCNTTRLQIIVLPAHVRRDAKKYKTSEMRKKNAKILEKVLGTFENFEGKSNSM